MSERDIVAALLKVGRDNALFKSIEEAHRLSTLSTTIDYMQACKDMAHWMRKEMDMPVPEDLLNNVMGSQK